MNIDKKIVQQIVERPKYLDYANGGRTSEKSIELNKLAQTLKMIDENKAIALSYEEFKKLYGEKVLTIVAGMKTRGIKAKAVKDGDTVYIWRRPKL